MTADLSPVMLRELRWIARWGEPGDLADYGAHALAFHARERVLSALLRRELIRDEPGGFVLTDAGRTAAGVAPSEVPSIQGYRVDASYFQKWESIPVALRAQAIALYAYPHGVSGQRDQSFSQQSPMEGSRKT